MSNYNSIIKKNIIANYASQLYTALAGIISVPLYAKYLGIEAYGVIGFYTLLQAWFQVLDIGLSTTLSRESSLLNADPGREFLFRRAKRFMEYIFYALAAVAVIITFTASDLIAEQWLRAKDIPEEEIKKSLLLIGIVIALRWLSCLYRGIITGFEQQIWLGKLAVVIASLRFLAPLPIIIFVDNGLTTYFSLQLGVAALEFGVLCIKSMILVGKESQHPPLSISYYGLQPIVRFASGVALTSIIWVIMTQSDKLILSKIVTLEEFGRVSMAVLLANGINMISGPISLALLPRLTALAHTNPDELIGLYRRFTQIVVTILIPVGVAMYVYSYEFMYGWTGDAQLADLTGPVMGLYALGNTVMAINSFGYYLQYAKGNIRLHVIGNIAAVVIYLPMVYCLASIFGAIGAGIAWVAINLLYFMLWIPKIHSVLAPGLNRTWYVNDVGKISIAAILPVVGLSQVFSTDLGRMGIILRVSLALLASFVCAIAASPAIRTVLINKFRIN